MSGSDQHPAHEPISVLIVEDHPIVRLGLSIVLGTQKDIRIVGEVSSELECLNMLSTSDVNLVILPLRLQGQLRGIELCREIKIHRNAPRVLIYTAFNSSNDASSSYLSGADSFLHKSEEAPRLLEAVRDTAKGKRIWLVGSENDRHLTNFRQSVTSSHLTNREREVLGFMLQRYSNREIARELFIELPTVKTHVTKILQKLCLTSRRELF